MPSDSILCLTFQNPTEHVVDGVVVAALVSGPVSHLRVCPCDLPEVATRELRRSVLLRVHSNRRQHDRASH